MFNMNERTLQKISLLIDALKALTHDEDRKERSSIREILERELRHMN